MRGGGEGGSSRPSPAPLGSPSCAPRPAAAVLSRPWRRRRPPAVGWTARSPGTTLPVTVVAFVCSLPPPPLPTLLLTPSGGFWCWWRRRQGWQGRRVGGGDGRSGGRPARRGTPHPPRWPHRRLAGDAAVNLRGVGGRVALNRFGGHVRACSAPGVDGVGVVTGVAAAVAATAAGCPCSPAWPARSWTAVSATFMRCPSSRRWRRRWVARRARGRPRSWRALPLSGPPPARACWRWLLRAGGVGHGASGGAEGGAHLLASL